MSEKEITDCVKELRNKVIELDLRLEKHRAVEIARIDDLGKGHEMISNKLDHVYSIINVHNEHYALMSAQMNELITSNRTMAGYLATLEKLRLMLDIANRDVTGD
tara:strand:- start:549 stop:863 length:315 start_codon:yes stop_codon:yes gene_type:complete